MKIGYARDSTLQQTLEHQIETLKEAGAEKFTGATVERTQFYILLQ